MLIMAIDPGKNKSGIAIVGGNKELYFKDIVISEDINLFLDRLLKRYQVDIIIIGDGTYSKKIRMKVEEKSSLPVKIVDEKNSTFEAEKKYRKEKQNWLFRLIKWKPARPVDDYAAVILAERYLRYIENK